MNTRIITTILIVIHPYLGKTQIKPNIAMESIKDSIYTNIQYAGNVGLFSIGIGKDFSKKMYLGLVYGYLPKSVNDAEVHTIAIKTYYRFPSKSVSGKIMSLAYIGTNINYGITQNTYLKYPNYYPDGYYSTNAIHAAPFVGHELSTNISNSHINKIGFYLELGTIDKYMANFLTSKQVSMLEIFNICFGLSINLIK